jgi:pimeloyl-[acyl-carrier protein] methyl ester esterase
MTIYCKIYPTQAQKNSLSSIHETLVFIHGWGVNGHVWDILIPKLVEKYTIYCIDLPGFGKSPQEIEEYTLDYLTQSILSIWPKTPSILMGWSMGGLIATHIARFYPQKVKKLITVSSSPCFLVSKENPFGVKINIFERFMHLIQKETKKTLMHFFLIQSCEPSIQKKEVRYLKNQLLSSPLPSHQTLKAALNLLKINYLHPHYSVVHCPFLQIYGQNDSLVPIKSLPIIQQWSSQSQQSIFIHSGHAPFISEPIEFIKRMDQFIQQSSL